MRAVTLSIIAALTMVAPACEDSPPWGDGGAAGTDEAAPDFGPTAAYNRRLVFLGPGAELPVAAVFDFTALSDSLGVRRGVRARLVDGARWQPLLDAGWVMESMREPWRLVPHGRLTLVVGETGDVSSLMVRDSTTTRLQLGATLAEHSPDVGTQLLLRSARLAVDDESVPGVLLDAQLGRAVSPERVARTTTTADDTAAVVSPTAIARPGAEALLLNNGGYYTVLTTAAAGALAWVRNAGRDDIRTGVRLEPTAWSTAEDGVQIPTAWRIVSADGELAGELTTESSDRITLDDTAELQSLAYVLVTGWIEDRTVRRNVFGLVRHVR